MQRLACTHCGASLRVPEGASREALRCPRCGQSIRACTPEDVAAQLSTPREQRTRPSPSSDNPLDFLAPPKAPDEIGRLGPYRVFKVLGTGGMGTVLLAEDPKLRRQVALKVLKKSQAELADNRERFIREAQATAAIEHDHIVPIYQVDEDRGIPFLAMKLLVGESLEARVEREGRLPAHEVIRIGREIAEGLAAAHERGLIHRDIKPANIWLEEGRDRVKIVDFGLALARGDEDDTRLTGEHYLVGTPLYMSPEQASGDIPLDHRTDLFSLGIVLYRLATGELPFKGKKTVHVLAALAAKNPPPPSELNPDVPRRLSNFIMQLLAKDPDDRPKNARVVVAALVDLAEAEEAAEAEVEAVVAVVEPPREKAKPAPAGPRSSGARRRPRRGKPSRLRETDEERLARRVIKFAIFAGICVFLLLAFLIIRNVFFKKHSTDDSRSPASLRPRLKDHA